MCYVQIADWLHPILNSRLQVVCVLWRMLYWISCRWGLLVILKHYVVPNINLVAPQFPVTSVKISWWSFRNQLFAEIYVKHFLNLYYSALVTPCTCSLRYFTVKIVCIFSQNLKWFQNWFFQSDWREVDTAVHAEWELSLIFNCSAGVSCEMKVNMREG